MDYQDYNEFKASWYHNLEDELGTNWPFANESPKQPKKIEQWFVDVNGLTVGKAENKVAAYRLAERVGGKARLYNPTPIERDQELREQRTVKQYQRGF